MWVTQWGETQVEIEWMRPVTLFSHGPFGIIFWFIAEPWGLETNCCFCLRLQSFRGRRHQHRNPSVGGVGDLLFEQVQSLAQLSSLPPAWLVVKVQGFALNRGRAWGHWGTGQGCDLKSLPLLVERRSPHRQPLQGFQFTPPSVGPSVISRSEQVLYQCYLLLSNIPALIEDSLTDFPSDSLWEPSGEIKIPGSHHRLLNQLLQGWALSQHEEQNLTPFFGWWKLTSFRQGLFRELNERANITRSQKNAHIHNTVGIISGVRGCAHLLLKPAQTLTVLKWDLPTPSY